MYIINSVKPDALIGIAYDFDDALDMLFKRKTNNGCSMFQINTFLSLFWNENHKCDYRSELIDYLEKNKDRMLEKFKEYVNICCTNQLLIYGTRYCITEIDSKCSKKLLNYIFLGENFNTIMKENDDMKRKIAQLECEPYRGEEFFKMLEEEKTQGLLQKIMSI